MSNVSFKDLLDQAVTKHHLEHMAILRRLNELLSGDRSVSRKFRRFFESIMTPMTQEGTSGVTLGVYLLDWQTNPEFTHILTDLAAQSLRKYVRTLTNRSMYLPEFENSECMQTKDESVWVTDVCNAERDFFAFGIHLFFPVDLNTASLRQLEGMAYTLRAVLNHFANAAASGSISKTMSQERLFVDQHDLELYEFRLAERERAAQQRFDDWLDGH